jgi:hypothetical protein
MPAGIEDAFLDGVRRETHEVVGALGYQLGLASLDPRPI